MPVARLWTACSRRGGPSMTDLDAAIRAELDNFCTGMCAQGGKAALLALVAEHEAKHRRLGPPHKDHSQEGLPLCQGWPYRPHQDTLCRHIRTIAEALGIEAPA